MILLLLSLVILTTSFSLAIGFRLFKIHSQYEAIGKEYELLFKDFRDLKFAYMDYLKHEQSKLSKALDEGWGPKSVEQAIDEEWTH